MNFDFKLNFLNRMRLGQKFALLGVFALAASALPTYQAISLAEATMRRLTPGPLRATFSLRG